MRTLMIILFFSVSITTAQVTFDEYFVDKVLRIDYQHAGDKDNDHFFLTQLKEEPYWGGSKTQLLDIFNYGKYRFEVQDQKTGKLIYSKNYSTLFSEWQTTEEAMKTSRSFPESVIMPYPKHPVTVRFFSRNKSLEFIEKYKLDIDPESYFVYKDRKSVFPHFAVHNSGDPASRVDIVIIPEGYTEDQMDKFRKDCEKFSNYLFKASPFKENKDKFNIWGIAAPSQETGTDIPGDGIYKNTNLSSGFYTFDVDRYLMTEDYTAVRDFASNAPYDQIYILVNTKKYGGGAIYNFYNVCVADNQFGEYIFTHEFGHGFAFLADEYYTSETGYIDFYPLNKEPLEPNVTTMVDFASKWKQMIHPETPVPTPATDEYKSSVGVFEGGGYVAKGVFRPKQDCTMKSITVDNFCPVCKSAIQAMIDFYTK